MSADTDNSRSSRRPRPEVHIYRPGSGPLKKSGSNADNIMSGSTTTSESGHDLAESSLRAVTLNSESVDGGRAKSLTGEGDGKGSRSKKNQGRRHEKSENKPHRGEAQNQLSGNEQRSKSSEHSSTSTANKQPANVPLPPPDKTANAANTNQDLRQLLLEKRMQRNNQSPATSNRDSSSDMPRRDSNTSSSHQPGKPPKNEAPSPQPPNAGEKLKNGHMSDSNQSSNSTRRNDAEQPGLSRNSEARGSTGRRRKDRKNPQHVETSRSEGHLSALATNNSSAPVPQNIQPLVAKSGDTDQKKEVAEGNANGKDRREGSGRNGKKKRNRGSRRGSTSSDNASTPLPESSLTDEHEHLRPVKEQEATGQLQSNPSLAPESSTRGRHVSSPIENRNRNEHHQISTRRQDQLQTDPPSASYRPTHVISPPHLSSRGPQRQSSNAFQHYHQPVSGNIANHRNVERHSSYPTNDTRPPTGRNGGRDRPPNLDLLPPRLRKKYEEEHGLLPTPPAESLLSASSKENTWNGASMTFSSAVGVAPIQSRPPPPFPPKHQPTPTPSSTGRTAQWSNSSSKPNWGGSGRIASGANEDVDVTSLVRPRSQDSASATGGYSDHSVRERKTSFNDSRSSTPSSSLDIGTSQQQLRGTLRRLEEVSHTQTSLDWSEEMEEEDRRSQVGDSRQQRPIKQQNAPASLPSDIKFSCSDVRYLNKPMKGYSVILSNGMDQNPPATAVPPPLIADHPIGRPILGQGRKQEPTPFRNSEPSPSAVPNRMSVPGLIQLPHGPPAHQPEQSRHSPRRADGPSSSRHQHDNRSNQDSTNRANSYRKVNSQRTLFDPSNPHKPIVVPHRDDNAVSHVHHQRTTSPLLACPEQFYQSPPVDSQSGSSSKPSWYDPHSESFRSSKSNPHLLMDLMRSDMELSWLIHGTGIIQRFARIQGNRSFFLNSLRLMLSNDLRFCQAENVEQHVWKVAFHNVIEALRKNMADESTEDKEEYRKLLFTVIDDGTAYFESLLETLQQAHNFNLDRYLEPQPYPILSGLAYVGLAVISCQKILIFLGDLARYREMTADTSNYGKAKSWYTKANLANPKNGRPYNQLAILALYARRKLDAVYLYMRSLMASNPFLSARESLVALFDENRKKYEQQERKRREAKEASSNRRREAAAAASDAARVDGRGLRREIWIHPLDGRRTRRTTSTSGSGEAANALNSDDEELAQLPSIEVNKRFVTSYLNVQGKLYTKIGMETFQECGRQMLREFRALLQQTPLPVNATRLLQLLALNMFAVSNTQLKDTRMAGGYRSAWQECALIVSLEMFNILLERCNAVLKEQLDSGRLSSFGEDLQIILPAVKVWCDWLLCHSMVWNPPPTSRDYHVGPAGTPWTRLATLINLLGRLDTSQVEITNQQLEGYEAVKLPEDVTLCGFTPLMLNSYEAHYTSRSSDMEAAADRVRIERLLYFGRDFLCGLDPPVLKLKFIGPSLSEYVSVVDGSGINSTNHPTGLHVPKDDSDDEDDVEGLLLNELERDEEVVDDAAATSAGSSSSAATGTDAVEDDMNRLRQRKDELTQKHLDRERRKQQLRAILLERVQVELEVRPKYLVADTNCYIDHLDAVVRLTHEKHYTLIAPLVVLNELEGLCRSRLAAESRAALAFLREKNPQVRYVTSKGAPLPTLLAAGTVNEENDDQALTNDDRILQCCLGLIKDKPGSAEDEHSQDGVRRLRRDVVLLTDDRNLRVKALTRDVPVRDLPAFLIWAASAATH